MENRRSGPGVRARAAAGALLAAAGVFALVGALAGLRADDSASADMPENPDAGESKHDFVNDTGQAASDLHIQFTVPVEKPIVTIKGGACPPPDILSDGDALVDIDWGDKCVEPDGLMIVSVIVFSKEEPHVLSVVWTNLGVPINPPTSTVTGTPPMLATAPSDSPTSTPEVPPTAEFPPTPFPDLPPVPTSTQVPGPLPTLTTVPATTVTPAVPHTPTATQTNTLTPTNTSPDTTPPPITTPILGRGDVNCDHSVDSIDAALLLQFNAGLLPSLACADDADVNQNGVINSIDAAIVLQFVAGLVPSLPV